MSKNMNLKGYSIVYMLMGKSWQWNWGIAIANFIKKPIKFV